MDKRTALVLISLMAVLWGCQNAKDPAPLSEAEQLANYSGPSEASTWRLEDKREIVTPCTIGGTPLLTLNLPLDTVDILNVYDANGYTVVLARWNTGNVCRFVRVRPLGVTGHVGYEAEILNGQVLNYGIQVDFDTADTNSIALKEYTLDDELEIGIESQTGGAIAETYSFNGASAFTFERDADPEVYDLQGLEAQLGNVPNATLASVTGAGSTLYDNEDGERLVSLVESHDFGQWLYNRGVAGDLAVSTTRWGFSDYVAGCTMIKCLAGGMANPLCATCTVVGGGLWFAKAVICGIGHCNDWPPGL